MDSIPPLRTAKVLPLRRRAGLSRLATPQGELLDASAGMLGMGRSTTFPFRQFRADDVHRTVYFDEGRGRPLVFVHGLGGNATHWERVAQRLAKQHRVVGLDLVGCGWSEKPEQRYGVEVLRDHLFEFLDRRGIGRATLLGHSMGGAVCLSAAMAAPERFESLVLVSSSGLGRMPAWMRLAAPVFLKRQLLFPLLFFGADFILDNVFVSTEYDNPHVHWFKEVSLRDEHDYPNLRDFARVCESLCRDLVQRDYTAGLAALAMPVLALMGDSDKLTRVPAALRSLSNVKRVRSIVIHRCGHMPMVERPEETTLHIEQFLRDPP